MTESHRAGRATRRVTPRLPVLFSIVLALAISACGDDGVLMLDAAVVDAPDAFVHPIVGVWERQPFRGNGPAPVVTFEASGRYRYDQDVGTWSITGTHLTTQRTRAAKATSPFYLSDDHATLMTSAFTPTTATDGLVGSWASDFTYDDGRHTETTFEFRADNSLTWTETSNGMPRISEGTWQLFGDSIEIMSTLGTTDVRVGMRLIPNVTIGDGLLVRIDQ